MWPGPLRSSCVNLFGAIIAPSSPLPFPPVVPTTGPADRFHPGLLYLSGSTFLADGCSGYPSYARLVTSQACTGFLYHAVCTVSVTQQPLEAGLDVDLWLQSCTTRDGLCASASSLDWSVSSLMVLMVISIIFHITPACTFASHHIFLSFRSCMVLYFVAIWAELRGSHLLLRCKGAW